MAPDRCADLILAAAFHGVDEAWVSPHPVLLFMYLFQFLPRLGYHLMRQVLLPPPRTLMLWMVRTNKEGRLVLGGQTDRPKKIASAKEWGEGPVQRKSAVLHLCSPEEIDMMPFVPHQTCGDLGWVWSR